MCRLRSSMVAFGTFLIGPFALGCSEELGPAEFSTSRVEGSIRVAGIPVTSGWIEFIPSEGTVGNLRSAPIGLDGSFSADRVAVGTGAIGLTNGRLMPNPGGSGQAFLTRFQGFQTPIRKQIPRGSLTRLDLDLADEWLAFQNNNQVLGRLNNPPTE